MIPKAILYITLTREVLVSTLRYFARKLGQPHFLMTSPWGRRTSVILTVALGLLVFLLGLREYVAPEWWQTLWNWSIGLAWVGVYTRVFFFFRYLWRDRRKGLLLISEFWELMKGCKGMKFNLVNRLKNYHIPMDDLLDELSPGRLWNLANLLTISRLFLLASMGILLPHKTFPAKIVLLIIVLIAILSDIADGWVARRLNQLTAWGKILDPVVDKIAAGVVLVLLHLYRDLSLVPVFFFVFKDLLIVGTGYVLIWSNKSIPASKYWSASSALLLAIAVCFYIFEINVIGHAWLFAAAVLAVWSLVDYAVRIER